MENLEKTHILNRVKTLLEQYPTDQEVIFKYLSAYLPFIQPDQQEQQADVWKDLNQRQGIEEITPTDLKKALSIILFFIHHLEDTDGSLDLWEKRLDNLYLFSLGLANMVSFTASQWGWVFVDILGEDHPLSQRFLSHALAAQDLDSSNNYLSNHRRLLKKRERPVKRPVIESVIGEETNGQAISFNDLEVYQYNNLLSVAPPHISVDQLKMCCNQLKEDYNKLSGDNKAILDSQLGKVTIDTLLEKGFNFLRKALEASSPQALEQKIGYLLREVMKGQGEPSNETTMSSGSNLLFQLLLNSQTCPAGKQEGVDITYQQLDLASRFSQCSNSLAEDFKRLILHYLDNKKRQAINQFVESIVKQDNQEQTEGYNHSLIHTNLYIKNLIGDVIGLYPSSETPKLDMNGGWIHKKILLMKRQAILNHIFEHFLKPIDLIKWLEDSLNKNTLRIFNQNGIDQTWRAIQAIFNDQLTPSDNQWVSYDQDTDHLTWTLEGATEILKRLGFLQNNPS